jgi:hypothetical protein
MPGLRKRAAGLSGSVSSGGVTMSPASVEEAHQDDLAPIDYLAVEFRGGRVAGQGFEQLLRLVDAGVIGILDLEFILKDQAGAVRKVDVSAVTVAEGVDLSAWEGSESGLLDDEDFSEIGSQIAVGSVAAVIIFENRWVLGVADAWRREGARLIADGGLSAGDVADALDATDAS